MAVNETSLAAYWSERLNMRLSNKCAEILDSLVVLGPATRQELAERTGMPINAVCGRVCDLISAGLAKHSEKVLNPDTLKEVWVVEALVNNTWTQPKVKREGWVNIYPKGSLRECIAQTSHAYPTEGEADATATSRRVACIRVEWEE